jgi:N-acyl amino acid synthase of PEP-CTERM/exosortase system
MTMNVESFTYGVIDGRGGFSSSLNAICQLRYQVYVNEWAFEGPEDHMDGLERDEYDQHSIHLYACASHSDDVIGAARIILGSEQPLPIERNFDISQFPSGIRREHFAEISRLAISKEFRCRAIEHAIFGAEQHVVNHMRPHVENTRAFRRRYEHQLVRGLYISLYRESKLRGVTHWFAVMAKGLYVILKRWGISFEQIGPARDYHGLRAPYLVSIESIECSLAKHDPALYYDTQGALCIEAFY